MPYLIEFDKSILTYRVDCSGLAPATALKRITPLDPEEYVVLIGAGGLGLQSIGILHAMGHQKVISVDIADEKLAAAEQAGATHVVNSATEDGTEGIKRVAGGPVKYVLDLVGSPQTTDMAFRALGKGGKLVIVGIAGGKFSASSVDMIFKGITVYGNMRGSLQGLRDVCELAKTGKMGGLPVRTTPWENATDALMQLRDGKVTGRLVLVHPEAERQ
jgi:alcohol dehydrogenase, propanol-preferring